MQENALLSVPVYWKERPHGGAARAAEVWGVQSFHALSRQAARQHLGVFTNSDTPQTTALRGFCGGFMTGTIDETAGRR